MIKAIETRYKGYRFRSRLEARWAVFFDALGLDWEYEPEGFDLGEAGWYLPDFLIGGEVFIEVKGGLKDGKEMGIDDQRKILNFANLIDFDKSIIVVGDIPEQGKEHLVMKLWKEKYKSDIGGHILVGSLGFLGGYGFFSSAPYQIWRFIPEEIGRVEYRMGMPSYERIEKSINDSEFSELSKIKISNYHITCQKGLGDVIDAYQKARSARFEHGETP